MRAGIAVDNIETTMSLEVKKVKLTKVTLGKINQNDK
jgi:hypothetical protein